MYFATTTFKYSPELFIERKKRKNKRKRVK